MGRLDLPVVREAYWGEHPSQGPCSPLSWSFLGPQVKGGGCWEVVLESRWSVGTEEWETEGWGEAGPRPSGGLGIAPLPGSSWDGTCGLTGSPSLAGWPHCEQRHGPVPGGGDVQGCQLWAPSGGAEVLRTEMDHQKLDQARAALTPSLTLRPHPNEGSKDLGQVWAPPTQSTTRTQRALVALAPPWVLTSPWLLAGPVTWDPGTSLCSGG